MAQQVREKTGSGGDDSGEETINLTFSGVDGKTRVMKVKKGTRLKAILAKLEHQYARGQVTKLNNRLLKINNETGELLEDPVLEENAVLSVYHQFTGGGFSNS